MRNLERSKADQLHTFPLLKGCGNAARKCFNDGSGSRFAGTGRNSDTGCKIILVHDRSSKSLNVALEPPTHDCNSENRKQHNLVPRHNIHDAQIIRVAGRPCNSGELLQEGQGSIKRGLVEVGWGEGAPISNDGCPNNTRWLCGHLSHLLLSR